MIRHLRRDICGFNKGGKYGLPEDCEEPPYDDEGFCIFHARKKDPNEFSRKFNELVRKTQYKHDNANAMLKGILYIDCRGFIIPYPAETLNINTYEIPIDFSEAEFLGDLEMIGTQFLGYAKFLSSVIKGTVRFKNVDFKRGVKFNAATFEGDVNFEGCSFLSGEFAKTNFHNATFRQVEFETEAIFNGTNFEGIIEFDCIGFGERAIFINAHFKTSAKFKRVWKEFVRKAGSEQGRFHSEDCEIVNPSATVWFAGVNFEKPERLLFKGLDLGEWIFAETPALSEATFIDVTWAGSGEPKRKHTGDEALALSTEGKEGISYETVAEVYRRLRYNYEKRLAYEGASDFHIGQMEMLLADPKFPDSKKFFLRIYKYISNYGEDVLRPLGWLLTLWYVSFLTLTLVSFTNEIAGISDLINSNFIYPWEYISIELPIDNRAFLIALLEPIIFLWGKFWSAFKNFIVLPPREAPALDFFINTIQKLAGGTLLTFAILALRRAFRR